MSTKYTKKKQNCNLLVVYFRTFSDFGNIFGENQEKYLPGIRDQGSGISDQGTGIREQGSGYREQETVN